MNTYGIPGALMDQLLAHIGNHPQRMELYATLSAYKQAQEVADKQSHANSLYVLGYDAEGHRTVAHMRSAHDARQDSDVMTQFLELEQATRLRGVVIPPHKVGALWVMSMLGTPPSHWDATALEVAQRFTQDTEPQRRASLQCAVVDAIRRCMPL